MAKKTKKAPASSMTTKNMPIKETKTVKNMPILSKKASPVISPEEFTERVNDILEAKMPPEAKDKAFNNLKNQTLTSINSNYQKGLDLYNNSYNNPNR